MSTWLLKRLFNAKSQANPEFAFNGTINWMRSLSILVDNPVFDDQNLISQYLGVRRRSLNIEADTLVLEKVTMALHNLAALTVTDRLSTNKYDLVRSSIISWYYVIYFTCSAMILATSGNNPETHRKTTRMWQNEIIDKKEVVDPFGLSIKNLVPKNIEDEIKKLRDDNSYDLNKKPTNEKEALGGVLSYLNGTANDYERKKIEKEVKNTSEFKKLGVTNFKTKKAQKLRDRRLSKGSVNFLTQAFRFRGKANYRDSIYLTYGRNRNDVIDEFTKDLHNVANKFLRMASFYISRRIEKGIWIDFINDLNKNLNIDVDLNIIEI